jgi:hypothetical protein
MGERENHEARYMKERRLLIGASCILLAHQFMGIEVGKSAESIGFHFDFSDPSRLWTAVWIIWAWAIVCSGQQCLSLKLWKKYPASAHEEAAQYLSNRKATKLVRSMAKAFFKSSFPDVSPGNIKVAFHSRRRLGSQTSVDPAFASIRVHAKWNPDDSNSPEKRSAEFDNAIREAGWYTPGGSIRTDKDEYSIERWAGVPIDHLQENWTVQVPSTAWTLLSTPYLMDYMFPFVIGIAPLLVAIWKRLPRI